MISSLELESNKKIYETINQNYQEELKRFDQELKRIRKEDARKWWEESTLKSC